MLGRDAVAGGAVEGAATEAGAAHAPTDLHLGFWRNPKRFNVAITRARAVLVVVGHPLVLLQDANWRELLRCVIPNMAAAWPRRVLPGYGARALVSCGLLMG